MTILTKLRLFSHLTRIERGPEMVISYMCTYPCGTPSRLPRLSDHVARRELAGKGLPAAIKQIVAPVPVKRFKRLADAGLLMKAVPLAIIGSGDG